MSPPKNLDPRRLLFYLHLLPPSLPQKVPATSVAPSFKLTLPCEWVETRLAHLLTGADFFLVGAHDDAKLYEAAVLPRRNKKKLEFALQGWRAFAVDAAVAPGDRVELC